MPKFLLKIGGDPIEFESETAEGFLSAWKDSYFMPDKDDNAWLRTAAVAACDWSGKPMRFDNVSNFASDMIDAGLIEEVE